MKKSEIRKIICNSVNDIMYDANPKPSIEILSEQIKDTFSTVKNPTGFRYFYEKEVAREIKTDIFLEGVNKKD